MQMTRKAFHANNTRILCWGIGVGLIFGMVIGIAFN